MIYGLFGLPRSGKTYIASAWGLRALGKGRPVYANYPLKGASFFDAEGFGNTFFVEAGSVVILDEVQWIANSRRWQELSDAVYFLFSQGGKWAIDLVYTAQHPARVDKALREVSHWWIWVERFFGRVVFADWYMSEYEFMAGRRYQRDVVLLSPRVWERYDTSYFVKNSSFVVEGGRMPVWVREGDRWELRYSDVSGGEPKRA